MYDMMPRSYRRIGHSRNDRHTSYDQGDAPTRNTNVVTSFSTVHPSTTHPSRSQATTSHLLTTQSPTAYSSTALELTYPKLQSPSLRSRSEYQILSTILLFTVPRWSLLQSTLPHAAFGVTGKDVARPDQSSDCTAPAHHHINLAISNAIPA